MDIVTKQEDNKKTLSGWRKEVYDLLRASGFDIDKIQGELSALLKSMHEKRFVDVNPEVPLKHELLCPKCGDYKLFQRKSAWKHFKRGLPKEQRKELRNKGEIVL